LTQPLDQPDKILDRNFVAREKTRDAEAKAAGESHVIRHDYLNACPTLKKTIEFRKNRHKGELPFSNVSILLAHPLNKEALAMIAAIRDLGCTDLSYQFSGYNDETCKYFVGELAKFPKTEVAYFMIEGKKVDLKKGMQYDLTGRPFPKVQFPIKKFLTNWASEGGSAGMDCHRCEVSLAAFLSLQALARAKESTPRGKLLVIEDGGVWGPIANATAFEKSNSIADYRINQTVPRMWIPTKCSQTSFLGNTWVSGKCSQGYCLVRLSMALMVCMLSGM